MASAYAFGRVFRSRGWRLGTARILHRVWQVYWVHVCLFLALAGGLAAFDAAGRFGQDHVASLNLHRFYGDPRTNLWALLTLRYVPNYFDILPMYLVILAMVPLVVAAHRIRPAAAGLLIAGIWALAQTGLLGLPAEPWSERVWFFNPFGWQPIFFTGFAFASGWIKPPPVARGLALLAVGALAASLPFSHYLIIREFEPVARVAEAIRPLTDKTGFGLLRYLHFAALAYLAWIAAGRGGARLRPEGARRGIVGIIHKVGRQALATFVAGSFLARFTPVITEVWGRGPLVFAAINILGFACLIATAYAVSWFKTERMPRRQAASPPRTGRAGANERAAATPATDAVAIRSRDAPGPAPDTSRRSGLRRSGLRRRSPGSRPPALRRRRRRG